MSDARAASFASFFRTATATNGTDGLSPYRWQAVVAQEGFPDVLPVPTGLGKTAVALAWAWRRLVANEPEPRHLVYCLPLRTLVTQTAQRPARYFDALRASDARLDVRVYQLLGGAIEEEWARWPEKSWILVGTQDQLLSRALNRGYAMSRFERPVNFGLLNNDCRWIIDEVQLIGPGLWTTAQLDWMRTKRFPTLKPCQTTWMSATVGTYFLGTTDRKRERIGEPSPAQLRSDASLKCALDSDQRLSWWHAAHRPVDWWRPERSVAGPRAIAGAVMERHQRSTLSLVCSLQAASFWAWNQRSGAPLERIGEASHVSRLACKKRNPGWLTAALPRKKGVFAHES